MIRKNIFGVSAIALLVLGPTCIQSIYSEEAAAYVGKEKCAPCHSGICATFENTRHAKAIDSLKKTSQEGVADCAKCHVTGYEKDGGFLDYELTPEMSGVQCEVCHGPGGKHIGDPMGGKMTREPGETLCRECHTKGQDPGFNYVEKVKSAHGEK